MTGRNKLFGRLLIALISLQLCFGSYFTARTAMNSGESFSSLAHPCQLIRPLAQPVPEINLDAFKLCIYKRWRLGEILFTNLVICFGTFSPSSSKRCSAFGDLIFFTPHSQHGIADLFAFLVIFITTKRAGSIRHPGIPSILDAILRGATLYFISIFAGQMLFELFLLFAPVSDA